MLDYVIALVAGLVSFLSPCVLPLVPAYIGYMGGRVANTVSAQIAIEGADGKQKRVKTPLATRFSTFLHGLAFVAGFTVLFVSFGVLIWQFSSIADAEDVIARVGGILIVVFGLHFMGIVPRIFAWLRRHDRILTNPLTSLAIALVVSLLVIWGFTGTAALWNTSAYPLWTGLVALGILMAFWMWLITRNAFVEPRGFWLNTMSSIDYIFYADTRRQMTAQSNQGFAGSAIMGVIFAAGWTPCIGPTLGVAITMAANGTDILGAAARMTFYSLGLGIPFLLTALLLDSAQGMLRRLRRYMPVIQAVSGVFLVIVGIFVARGDLQDLSSRLTVEFSDFTYRLDNCTTELVEGNLALGDYRGCLRGDEPGEDAPVETSGAPGQNLVIVVALGPGCAEGDLVLDVTSWPNPPDPNLSFPRIPMI